MWSLGLNVIVFVGVSFFTRRRPSSACRQSVFVPRNSCRSRRASALALFGDRGGFDRDGVALSRRGAHAPLVSNFARTRGIPLDSKRDADAHAALRRAFARLRDRRRLVAARAFAAASQAHCLDQGGAASSSTTLPPRFNTTAKFCRPRSTTSARASRCSTRILQLVCWNRHFGEMLDLPPELVRIGVDARRDLALSAPSAATSATAISTRSSPSGSSVTSRERRAVPERLPTGMVVEVRPTGCRTAASS